VPFDDAEGVADPKAYCPNSIAPIIFKAIMEKDMMCGEGCQEEAFLLSFRPWLYRAGVGVAGLS